jgi:hypothetical protein
MEMVTPLPSVLKFGVIVCVKELPLTKLIVIIACLEKSIKQLLSTA